MCNNNHWNLAQIVPDCQLKVRPVRGRSEKLKAEWEWEEKGGESAGEYLIKAASCQQLDASVEAAKTETARGGEGEVDWEEEKQNIMHVWETESKRGGRQE